MTMKQIWKKSKICIGLLSALSVEACLGVIPVAAAATDGAVGKVAETYQYAAFHNQWDTASHLPAGYRREGDHLYFTEGGTTYSYHLEQNYWVRDG